MALGFQDCCNSSSYFLLTGIPASVQEFETYLIQTLQGETFCAKYVELPKLNYSLPIYTLVTMTQQSDINCPTYTIKILSGIGCSLTYTNCGGSTQSISALLNATYQITAQQNTISISVGCTYSILSQTKGLTACQKCIVENPCPSEQSIFLSQFGAGTVATSTDCYIKTIFPMVVTCQVDPPTSELTSDGILGLYIIGGVAPYVAYEVGTHLTDNPIVYDVIPWNSPNTYIVRQNLPEGTYSLTVTDSQGNFFVDVTCTLDAPPAPATITCAGTAPSTSFENNGSITINIAGGIPPYTLLNSNGVTIQTLAADGSITINNLISGNYTYTVVETAQGSFQANQTTINCIVPAGVTVNYPSSLCLSMLLCSQTGNQNTFYLTLIQQGQYNNRPVYVLSSYSASIIGNPTGFKIQWGGDNVGWTSVAGTAAAQPQFATSPSNCTTSNLSFSLTSSYTAGGTISLTALPQNFTWTSGSGYLTNLNAQSISLSSNACPVNIFVSNTSDTTICQNNVNSDANIILTANGGSGGYSFFYRKGTTGSYTGPVPSPITIASSLNAAGFYQVYAVDSSGVQSSVTTFTIINSCLTLTVSPSSPDICPNWEDINGVVTFTLTSSNSTGPYTFYWRKQSTPALQWNVISSTDNTETVTVYGSANPGNQISLAGNYGYGTYEFYVESANGDNSGIVTSTLNDIPCEPVIQPLTFSKTVTLATCTNSNMSIQLNFAGGTPPYTLYYQILPGEIGATQNLINYNFCPPNSSCNLSWYSFPITTVPLSANQTQYNVTIDTFNEYLTPGSVGPFVLNLNSTSQPNTTINNQYSTASFDFGFGANPWNPISSESSGPPIIVFWYKDSTDTYFPNNLYSSGFNVNSTPNFSTWTEDNFYNQICFLIPPSHISVITQMSVVDGSITNEVACTSLQDPTNAVSYSSADTGQCYNWSHPLNMMIGVIAPYTNLGSGVWDSVNNQVITSPTTLQGWIEIRVKRQYIYSLGYNASLNATSFYLLLGYSNLQNASLNEFFWPVEHEYDPNTQYRPINNAGFIFDFPTSSGGLNPYGGLPTTWPTNKIGGGDYSTNYTQYPKPNDVGFVDSYTSYKTNYKKTTSPTADASTTNPAATVNTNFMPASNYSSWCNLYNASCSQLSQLYYGYNTIGDIVYTQEAIPNPFFDVQSDGQNWVGSLLSVSDSCVNNGCADGATVNGCPVVWTNEGKKFVANFAGTLSTESVFTIGSENEPLTLTNQNNSTYYTNESNQIGMLQISFQWQGQHAHVTQNSPLLNNCELSWGQGVQIETIFHPTTQIKCIQQTSTTPGGTIYYGQYTNQDIPIKYYHKKVQACTDSSLDSNYGFSCNSINGSGSYWWGRFYSDFTDQTSFGASIQSNKILGNQNQYPDPSNFGNEKIID